jgi:hypothetical protein
MHLLFSKRIVIVESCESNCKIVNICREKCCLTKKSSGLTFTGRAVHATSTLNFELNNYSKIHVKIMTRKVIKFTSRNSNLIA